MFSTVRPSDYSVPYSVLEKNSVAFSAVDKRSNKLLTVMVGEVVACSASIEQLCSTCMPAAWQMVTVV